MNKQVFTCLMGSLITALFDRLMKLDGYKK